MLHLLPLANFPWLMDQGKVSDCGTTLSSTVTAGALLFDAPISALLKYVKPISITVWSKYSLHMTEYAIIYISFNSMKIT